MTKTGMLSFRVDPFERYCIAKLARKYDMNISEYIREVAMKGLDEKKTEIALDNKEEIKVKQYVKEIRVRVTEEEKQKITDCAKEAGLSISEYVRKISVRNECDRKDLIERIVQLKRIDEELKNTIDKLSDLLKMQ